MSYIDPKTVRSPKALLTKLKVLADKGEGKWSLAEVEWDGDICLAVRWNGSSDEKNHSVGTPQSRGLPMWFILPDDSEFSALVNDWMKKAKKK